MENLHSVEGVKILSATVSEKAGNWFVSIQVEEQVPDPPKPVGEVIGIDLGIKALATCSNGDSYDNPQALKAKTKQLKRWQQRLSRREKGSSNRGKAKKKVAKLHSQVANLRKDALHKVTSAIIAKKPTAIVIEDLNVSGMMANHKLARTISDVGMHEFRRQITYKAEQAGIELVIANRFYPSSKTCSQCSHIKQDLTLNDRTYHCFECGLVIDRDLNASINLKHLSTASSAGSNACGDGKVHSFGKVAVCETGTKQQMYTFV